MGWNFSDDVPIYIQIMNHIKIMIISGIYKAGDKLPSIREIASDAGVNPNTVQKALQELERCGLIFSQRSVGKYITEDSQMIKSMKNNIAQSFVNDFFEKMSSIGFNKEETFNIIQSIIEGRS